jgi:hypothetical protein
MWAGGFTTSPVTDGIFKYTSLTVVVCSDASVNSGITSAPDSTICFGDTLFINTQGAVSPSVGTTFGWSMIVSSGDISFNNDPLSQPGILGGTGVVYPPATNQPTTLINDASVFVAGVYYFTPVVYGNATGTGNVTALTLDPTCTFTGQSVMVTLYDVGEPLCLIGLNEMNSSVLSMNAFQSSENQMSLNIVSAKQGNLTLNVYDITGRLVINQGIAVSKGANSQVIDIAGINAGTYVIRLSDNNGVVTSKMIRY